MRFDLIFLFRFTFYLYIHLSKVTRKMVVISSTCNPARCGKDFWDSLKRPSPILGKTAEKGKLSRIVPAFTLQALQKNTRVLPPPICGVFRPLPCKPTKFREAYLRQELPICVEFIQCGGRRIGWKVSFLRNS